jgi:outer membrane lipopolysaccharide assembly protein LptE/RlpB
MRKNLAALILMATVALCLTACGWNPSVAAVPITAPWDKMNLPVREDARVWASDDKTLKVVHKAARREVAQNYVDALEKDGWKMTTQPDVGEHSITFDFEKGGQKIEVEVYDFENTGVIIEKK